MPLPLGFVPPCLPTKTPQPPTGEACSRILALAASDAPSP
jgi:hypothetical protein